MGANDRLKVGPKARSGRTSEPNPEAKTDPDYNGLPLENWEAELAKDVKDRFGAAPENLTLTSDPGW